jgi:ribosomal protein S18 acetylase RimI-like enzyme
VTDVEIRAFRPEDAGPAFAILAAEQREIGEPELSEGMFANIVAIADTSYAAELGGELVGDAHIRGASIDVQVRKAERRRGIGTRLLQAVEDGTDAPVLRLGAPKAQPAAAAFSLANGYEKGWDVWLMGIDLDETLEPPRWPDDVAVRTFRVEDGPLVHELLDLAYAEEPDHEPMSFEDWKTFMLGDPNFDASSWFLAEAEGELAAAILNWDDGFVKDLVVHPERRRRGLGEGLMRHTFREFRRRGHDRVTLKTDSVNPTEAWRLYERLGMRKERTYEMFEKTRPSGTPGSDPSVENRG